MAHRPVTTDSPGNAPDTGSPPGTPAPVKKYVRDFTREQEGGPRYGRNDADHPSSLAPGETLSADLDISAPGGDPVLNAIKHLGAGAGGGHQQSRTISDAPIAPAHGLKSQQSTPGALPSTVAKDTTDEPRGSPEARAKGRDR
jgi:hypothetical protein